MRENHMKTGPRRSLAKLLGLAIILLVIIGIASWLGSIPWAGLGSVR